MAEQPRFIPTPARDRGMPPTQAVGSLMISIMKKNGIAGFAARLLMPTPIDCGRRQDPDRAGRHVRRRNANWRYRRAQRTHLRELPPMGRQCAVHRCRAKGRQACRLPRCGYHADVSTWRELATLD
jgi:hypothetical protein